MAVTSNSYTGNGSTTNYSITFPYIATTDIKAQIDGVATTAFSLANATTVAFSSAPANGAAIVLYRTTDDTSIPATFYAGSSIRSEDLNNNFTQTLYIGQETASRAITNLGGTMTGDLTMGQNSKVLFEGSTDDAHETTLTVTNPTADRTITLPNVTGTVVTTGDTGSVSNTMLADAELQELATMSSGTASALADLTQTEVQAIDGITASTAELNKLDGVTASTAELNKLDGVTATTAEINHVDGVTSNVQAQLDAKQPLDAELTELATMAGTTASSLADLTQAEVQILDGATVSTTELNYVDGVTSAVQTQLDAKQPLDSDLTTLSGMQAGTASILASSTALTSTTAELNLLDGKSVVTSVSGSSTDVQLPTAKAVNDQIVALLQDIGGFYPIDDELKFPNTNPDPNDDAGTIVSIADAGGIVVNGSGVSTTGRTLGGATVTINGIDSTLHGTTVAAGKGMLVQTTSTLNTYTYHRLIVDEAGVAAAQTLVSDFGDKYQIAGSAPTQHPDGSALAEGDLWFDSSANIMKVYDGSNYAAVTSVGDYKLLTVVPDGATSGTPTFNGSNLSFDLRDGGNAASVTSVGQLLVSLNGVLQKPNSTSWSASNEGFHLEGTNGIKFCTAPPSGSSIFVTLIGSATSVNVPATNSIVEAAIQTNQVSEEKLKISNSPTNGYYLQAQSGNSGGLTWAAVAQYSTPLTTQGDILYRDGSGDQRLAAGTSGQVLTSGGSGANVSWADAAAGASGGGSDKVFWENGQTVTTNYTITNNTNAGSFGPITINSGITVTVGAGENWTVI